MPFRREKLGRQAGAEIVWEIVNKMEAAVS